MKTQITALTAAALAIACNQRSEPDKPAAPARSAVASSAPAPAPVAAQQHDAAIRSTIETIFSGVDGHRWDAVEKAMTPELRVDYSALGGPSGPVRSKKLVAGWKGFLPKFERTVHELHDIAIHVAGDRATATFTGIALHALTVDGQVDTWTVLAGYDTEFVRSKGAWKLARIDLSLRAQAGNLELPKLAQAAPVTTAKPTQPHATVERFFGALESNDKDGLLATLAPTVVQSMPFAPEGFPRDVKGIEAVGKLFSSVIDKKQKYRRTYHATKDPRVVVANFDGEVRFEGGKVYRNSYVNVFRLDGEGRIEKIEEHFDPVTLLRNWPGLSPAHHSVHPSGASTKDVVARSVSFQSGKDKLAGRLFVPAAFDEDKPHQAVVVTGSWTSVKEQMPDVYASQLAARGFVALSFDFAGFGQSEGSPRQLESPKKKIRDIRAAVGFLGQQPGVKSDAVSGLGLCASAGYMAHAAAEDSRIANLVLVAPWLHDEKMARGIYDGRPGGSQGLIKAGRKAAKKYQATQSMDYVLAASELDPQSAMYVPNNVFDYYLNPTKGAGSLYDNRFAVASWEPWITFDGISAAKKIEQPVHIVHSEKGAIPDGARRFYKLVKGDKSVEWLNDFTQADFYYEAAAVKAAADHLVKHLR